MRNLVPLALATALLTSACEAFGAARGLAVAAVLLTGALAWLAHRGHAHAGGSTGSTGGTSSTTDAGTTGSTGVDSSTTDSSTADAGTTGSTGVDSATLDSTASGGTVDSTSTVGTTAAEGTTYIGPCLSIGTPETETGDPELLPCLCACETGTDRNAADLAPALLLPLIARRRRNRRRSLERIAATGRLPDDVVARLRNRLERDD
jgi:hypothetical protein